MRLQQAIKEFREWLGPRKLSTATLRAYDQDLRVISQQLAASAGRTVDNIDLDDISISEIRSAFASYAQGHSRASILRVHSTWNQFFDFLVADGKVTGNPMAAVNRPKSDQRAPKPLDGWADDTVPVLLRSLASGEPGESKTSKARDAWPERDLAIVATLLATGTRSSELLQMNLSSLAGGRGEQVIHVVGKGDKPRAVPVEPQLDELLGVYLETRKQRFTNWKPKAADPLFVGTRLNKQDEGQRSGGKRMTSNQLYYLLKRCLGEAGLANRRPRGAMAHAFRHTFGTTLAAQGAPVAAIRKLMGHSSITTSQGYIDSLAREERNVAAQNRVYDVLRGLFEET